MQKYVRKFKGSVKLMVDTGTVTMHSIDRDLWFDLTELMATWFNPYKELGIFLNCLPNSYVTS